MILLTATVFESGPRPTLTEMFKLSELAGNQVCFRGIILCFKVNSGG